MRSFPFVQNAAKPSFFSWKFLAAVPRRKYTRDFAVEVATLFAPNVFEDQLRSAGIPVHDLSTGAAYRPVAALVYRHRQHPINVFVLPASSARSVGSESFSEHGYNVLHWRHGDMSLWAASDLNLAELKEFQRLYEQRTAASPAS